FENAMTTETQPQVIQDLSILVNHMKLDFRREDFQLEKEVPYYDAATLIYNGLEILLDEQTPTERRAAVMVRLRKYAGLDKGYRPITAILQERTAEQIAKGRYDLSVQTKDRGRAVTEHHHH